MKKQNIQKIQSTDNKSNHIYGVIGMVALFLIGAIFGFVMNGSNRINHSIMTQEQCEMLAEEMENVVRSNHFNEIRTLNKVYSENCLNREFNRPNLHQKSQEDKFPETTCGKIESLLNGRIAPANEMSPYAHIENAKIYANLSERGCPENSQKYKELAKQEIDIARALTDDNIEQNQYESMEIVETYKRLQMQAEAERMIEKAKKLTNPAIDFIIQLEKIIEE